MATYSHSIGGQTWRFDSLREVLAKASPLRSGDCLAGVAATSDAERAAAQMTLADVPLKQFLLEAVIPYERDEVTRLIIDSHDGSAFDTLSTEAGGIEQGRNGRGHTRTSVNKTDPPNRPVIYATHQWVCQWSCSSVQLHAACRMLRECVRAAVANTKPQKP